MEIMRKCDRCGKPQIPEIKNDILYYKPNAKCECGGDITYVPVSKKEKNEFLKSLNK